MMLNIPEFKSNLYVEIYPGKGVLVLSEKSSRVLQGRAYELVVPLINSQFTSDEIVDELAGKLDGAVVYYVLERLEKQGYLTEVAAAIPDEIAAFWHEMGIEPRQALENIRNEKVAVISSGRVNPTAMVRALANVGIDICPEDEASLWIVVTDDYQREDLAIINKKALEKGLPWLLLRPNGSESWLGPLFKSGETACWQCLNERLQANRNVHIFVARKKGLAMPPMTAIASLPLSREVLYHMAALMAVQYLAGVNKVLEGEILTLDWQNWDFRTNQIIKNPYCQVCGEVPIPAPEPLKLQPGEAAFRSDGGHRRVTPEQTLKKYKHLVSPLTGIVSKLAPALQDNDLAHVFVAGSNQSVRTDDLDFLKRNLRSACAGKGKSEIQAKVSALCEAVERYCGQIHGGEVKKTQALKDWELGEAYHPNEIMNYSERQYREREIWNSKKSRFNVVPEPFTEDLLVDWTPLWSLTENRFKYLPTQLVYYTEEARDGDSSFYTMGSSNGNASGNTIEEAILQGFFELVERDSVAIWWYNRLSRPGVALESFNEPYLLKLAEHYKEHYGREIWALDLTTDLKIPTFVALSRTIEGPEERILFGLGCHLDARIALQRSFTEMNQMMGLAYCFEEDGKQPLEDDETLRWLREATIANQPYLLPDPTKAPRRFSDYPKQHSGEFLQDINYCRKIIEEQGMEMLVLDQTRAHVGMPVVKVVVPGLRHFWARFAPGRLYDVPVKMGWLKRHLDEEELNPIPIFI